MKIKIPFKKPPAQPSRRQSTRTIGARPSTVFSYHAVRDREPGRNRRQPEIVRHPNKVWDLKRPVLTILLIVMVLVFIGNSTVLSTNPNITVLGSATDQSLLQDQQTYQQGIKQLLMASPADHNKLTIDTTGLAMALQTKYPEFSSITVTVPLFGHDPTVELQPAVPSLLLHDTAGGTYVLADTGKALALASTVPNLKTLHLPTVNDQSGLAVKIGSTVLATGDISFIQFVVQQFQEKGIAIQSLTLPAQTSELDVQVSGQPYFVKLNLEADEKQQVGTYFAVESYLVNKKITPGQYIDVRTLGRAYYK